MAEAAATTTISVQCPCGKKLKAPATAVGRKAKCPKCGNVMTVTAPAAPPKPPKPKAPPAPPSREEIDDALYDLAADAQSAAASAPAPVRNVCPSCQSPMASGAVLCTACGYDTRTGKSLAGAKATTSAPAAVGRGFPPALATKVNVEKPEPTGSMLKGAIISAVFAFIGALVWFGIAKATHREIGWIAWGVGIAAGFGMMIGYNGTSVSAGGVAAMFSVGGILLGKWMVFTSVVLPMFSGLLHSASGEISDEDKLHVYVLNQQLEKKGLDPEAASDAQSEAAGNEADKLIAKMDARTRAAEIVKAKDSFKRFESRIMEEIPRGKLFFKTMFDPVDLIFFVIAIASAFKVATFGGQVEGST
jgi:hypothetical protein